MPNCFTLQRLHSPTVPVPFNEIDDELRQALNQEPDTEKYLFYWYDIIGLRLAMGQSLQQIHDTIEDDGLKQVAAYLLRYYTSDAWAQIGKR